MRAGPDSAGDSLDIDIALIRDRQPGLKERCADLVDARPAEDRGRLLMGIDRSDAGEVGQVE